MLATEAPITEEEEGTPNNDFCFTEEDFIATQTEMNDATRHQGNHNAAWRSIQEMKGEVVNCNNTKDGKCAWTVVESVTEDVFESVRKKEEEFQNSTKYAVMDEEGEFGEESYNSSFWFLWPQPIDKDLQILNKVIEKDNL